MSLFDWMEVMLSSHSFFGGYFFGLSGLIGSRLVLRPEKSTKFSTLLSSHTEVA